MTDVPGRRDDFKRRGDLLMAAFTEQLDELQVELRREDGTAQRFQLTVRVIDRTSHRTIAVLEVADPEYIGLVLDSGANFWDHEWDESVQVEYAYDFGYVVAQHLRGLVALERKRGILGRERLVYTLQLGDETLRSRDVIAGDALSARLHE